MRAWEGEVNEWDIITLDLAGDNPILARELRAGCTYTEVAHAWCNNRRKTYSVGYRSK